MAFRECHCSVQAGFTSPEQQPRQIAYRPTFTVNDLQTNVASGGFLTWPIQILPEL